jgi:predicted MPP superfamily phosphohydrolase
MRRRVLVLLFLAVLLGVLVGGHLYLAQRLVWDLDWPAPTRDLLLVLIFLGAMTLLLQPFGERRLPPRLARWIAWPASLWMGFAFLLLTLLLLTDVTWALLGATFSHVGHAGPAVARTRALAAVGIAALAGAAGVRGALRGPMLRRVSLHLPRWPRGLDGFRIVQLSDIHIGPILDRRFAAELTRRCNSLSPDLIAITGDLVDGSVARIAEEVAPFAGLRARHGVFFVTGNHDHYSGADAWVEQIRRLGFRVLRNERVTIGDGDDCFDLAGVEDHHAHLVSGNQQEDLPKALAGRDPARPLVLLAHDPATFDQAARMGVDLQLSGHTHGGQIWPFAYLVRLSTAYVAGHYRKNGSQLYVSRGTGFWGPAMRLFAPAEITEIVVNSRVESR